jgi:hypothetical protein
MYAPKVAGTLANYKIGDESRACILDPIVGVQLICEREHVVLAGVCERHLPVWRRNRKRYEATGVCRECGRLGVLTRIRLREVPL